VADSDGLENRCGCKPTVGSNPTPSASQKWSLMPMAVAPPMGRCRAPAQQCRGRQSGAVRHHLGDELGRPPEWPSSVTGAAKRW
jgi:hypothetical protein